VPLDDHHCYASPEGDLYWWLVGIAATGTVFQATDVIDYWYQAEVRSKYTVYARNGHSWLLLS